MDTGIIPVVFQAASVLALLAYPSHVLMYAPGLRCIAVLMQLEIYWVYICDTESQDDLYTGVPLVGRLTGIKEMKVETIAVGKHHNMRCSPYMWHCTAIIFHFGYLYWISGRCGYFIQEMAMNCEEDQ